LKKHFERCDVTTMTSVTWRHRWRHQSTALTHFPIQPPNGKKSVISNSFRDIWPEILWIHDVITDVTLSGSTVRVHHFYALCSRWLC